MRYIGIGILLGLLIIVLISFGNNGKMLRPQPSPTLSKRSSMQLVSSAFDADDAIPNRFTCDGDNSNPPLAFAGIPTTAKSLALIMDDPDAPMGTWVHWTVWNIPPTTTEIGEKSVPPGAIEGTTSGGKTGYSGPCPPSGVHHYHFKIYALDTPLTLNDSAQKADLEAAMEGHIVDQAELIGTYARNTSQ